MAQRIQIESIDKYMKDIRKYERVTVEEEVELADKIMHGSQEEADAARNRLMCANLRLVVKIAHDFKHFGLGFADLVSEGNLGLITAVDKFDPAKGAKFSCYAAWWIKQAMRKAIIWQSRVVRIPGGSAQRLLAVDKARSRLQLELGREPDAEEVSAATGLSVAQIERLDRSATEVLSLDSAVSEDSSTTFDQLIAETVEDDTEEKKASHEAVSKALAQLPQLDRTIIHRLFGFDGACIGLQQLAQEIGMSMDAIQQRLDGVLLRLRDDLSAADIGY